MISVLKGVLKARMLEYFRQVEQSKEELIVTDHHKSVLRILPYKAHHLPTDVFAQCKTVIYYEDITIPTTHV